MEEFPVCDACRWRDVHRGCVPGIGRSCFVDSDRRWLVALARCSFVDFGPRFGNGLGFAPGFAPEIAVVKLLDFCSFSVASGIAPVEEIDFLSVT